MALLLVVALVAGLGALDLRFMVAQGKSLSAFNTPIGNILACLRSAPPNALVLATEKENPYSDLRHGLCVYNPQGLESQPLVARSLGEGDHVLARAFGPRTPFHLVVDQGVPRLIPFVPRVPYLSPPMRDYPACTGQRVPGGVPGDEPQQVAKAGRDKAEALAFGVFHTVIPGTFVVDFDLLISNAPPDQLAVTLDVSVNRGRTSLIRHYLTGDVDRVVSLPVSVKQLDIVEPRVFYAGVGDVIFRGARLRELPPATSPRR